MTIDDEKGTEKIYDDFKITLYFLVSCFLNVRRMHAFIISLNMSYNFLFSNIAKKNEASEQIMLGKFPVYKSLVFNEELCTCVFL